MTSLGELAGKKIGTRLTIDSGTGGGVLMMLEAVGLDLRDITWVSRNTSQPAVNRMGLRIEPGPDLDQDYFEGLRRGDFDAVMFTAGPRYWSMFGGEGDKLTEMLQPYPDLRPLVDDPAAIAETFRRTRLYSITDLAVVKPDLAAQSPEAPARVVKALAAANARASHYRPASEQKLAEREIELLGEDPHRYGLGPEERSNIATLLDLFYRLGSIERRVDPEELFVPSVAHPL